MNPAPQHRAGSLARRGFTLLETLLVLGLMSMLAAVLIGGSAQLLKGTARSDPEDALMALLQTIRRQAVEKGKVLELAPTDTDEEDAPDFLWGEENVDEDHPRTEEKLPKIEGVKVKIGLARGKNVVDKRETIKKRESDRDTQRAMRTHNG